MSTTPPPASGKKRVLIVDDHPIVRRGLDELLSNEQDIQVCGGAESVADAMRQLEAARPDLVVVDISLKDSHGIELIAAIKDHYPEVRTLVWSMFDEEIFAERAVRAGALGYVNKKEPIEKIVEAIREVLRGNVYLSLDMTNRLIRRACLGKSGDDDPIHSLSNRELQVFQMIGAGLTTRQVARKLGLSPKTIEAHREKIKSKLGVANAAELSHRAVQWVLENG